MGETTVFECSACGYRSGEVRWGVASGDARIRFMAALCRKCQDIVGVELTGRDVLFETFACPGCGSPVAFLQKSETIACPRCAAPNMRIRQKGYW